MHGLAQCTVSQTDGRTDRQTDNIIMLKTADVQHDRSTID